MRARRRSIGSCQDRSQPAGVRAGRRHQLCRPARADDTRRAGRQIETAGCGDRWQEVRRPCELHARKLLDLERDHEMTRRSCSAIVDPRVEPVVASSDRRLMRRSAIVGIANPEIRRVPEAAAPQLRTGVRRIVSKPDVRRRRRIDKAVDPAMEGVDEIRLARSRDEMRLEIERGRRATGVLAIELAHPGGQRGRRGQRGDALEESLARRVGVRRGHARIGVARRQRDGALGEVERLRARSAAVVIDVPRFVPPRVRLARRLDAASPPRVKGLVTERAEARRAAAVVLHPALDDEDDENGCRGGSGPRCSRFQ